MTTLQDRLARAARDGVRPPLLLTGPPLGGPAGRLFDDIAIGVLALLAVAVVLTYQDYGLVWDAEVQNTYGKLILDYYLSGFTDRRLFDFQNLYLYGGSFDLVAALLNKISPLGEYETRNLLGGFIGVLGIAGTWRFGRLVGGPRAGLIALVLIALEPSYYGHMFVNPKDLPFAAGMIWTVHLSAVLLGQCPRPRRSTAAWLGVVLGLTLGTRIGGVLAMLYLGAAVTALTLIRLRRGGGRATWTGTILPLLRALPPAMVLAYGVMALLWPYAVQSVLNPLRALETFSHFPWQGEVLLDGRPFKAMELPASYLPLLLAIKMPEIALVGLILAAGAGVWSLRRIRCAAAPDITAVQIGLVATAALFPIAYFVIARPVAYNGIRHFLFVLPPLSILAALGFERLCRALEPFREGARRIGVTASLAILGFQSWSMVRLHPDEYIYYNQLVGGVRGAATLFELDYWGTSLAEAAQRLAAYVRIENGGRRPAKPVNIMVCGWPLSATYFLPMNFRMTSDPKIVDFFIAWTESGCDKAVGGKEIIRVERGGALLSVVKDMRSPRHAAAAQPDSDEMSASSPIHPLISLDEDPILPVAVLPATPKPAARRR